jgi:hypothetical protein
MRSRTVALVQPGSSGTVSHLYSVNTVTVTVTDPKGKWKKSTMDGLGRLVQVTEPRPGAGGAAVSETDSPVFCRASLERVR